MAQLAFGADACRSRPCRPRSRATCSTISSEGPAPRRRRAERNADLQGPAGQPRQRARGVPHARRARHPRNRKRPPSAPAGRERARPGAGVRLRAEHRAGEPDARHRDPPRASKCRARSWRPATSPTRRSRACSDLVGQMRAALGDRDTRAASPPTWRSTPRSPKPAAIRSIRCCSPRCARRSSR